MTTPDRVYQLLPAIHRLRDLEVGEPLRQLLSVIEDQLESLESDIQRLYDDMFVETCQGPLIDHFADLVAVQLGPLTAALIDADTDAEVWISRRHQVIVAIAARAAKGTLGAIERIANEATGWPVRAIEQGDHVAVTQSVRFPDVDRGKLVHTRDDASLLGLGMPGTTATALADVRRGCSALTKPTGPHPTTVTVTLWRQDVEHIHRAPAVCVDDDNHYTFDSLGYDEELAVAPTPRRPGTPPAGDLDLPVEITRRQLRRNLDDYYGTDRSLCVYRGESPIPRDEIVVADLSEWADDPDYGQVALDPETGRIAFPPTQVPEQGVWVRYHRLGAAPIGANTVKEPTGEGDCAGAKVYQVAADTVQPGVHKTVTAAVEAWTTASREVKGPTHGIVEILDSGVYEEDFDIRIAAGKRLDIRAAVGHRPILRSVDAQHNRPKRVRVEGYNVKGEDRPAVFSMAGITITEHALELRGEFDVVALDHCTIMPERRETDRRHVAIAITAIPATVCISSSIIGVIRVNAPEVGNDPVRLAVYDSIIDAGRLGADAIGGTDDRPAYVELTLERSTVLGEIDVFETGLVRNSLITGVFHSEQRQTGEVRFCYLPPGSRVPRRTGCQPDGVLERIQDDLRMGAISPADAEFRSRTEPARVRPRFDSVQFGAADYARLTLETAPEITHGSDDDAELGAHHDLWVTRRIEDMRARLAEFTPIGIDLDFFFAT